MKWLSAAARWAAVASQRYKVLFKIKFQKIYLTRNPYPLHLQITANILTFTKYLFCLPPCTSRLQDNLCFRNLMDFSILKYPDISIYLFYQLQIKNADTAMHTLLNDKCE